MIRFGGFSAPCAVGLGLLLGGCVTDPLALPPLESRAPAAGSPTYGYGGYSAYGGYGSAPRYYDPRTGVIVQGYDPRAAYYGGAYPYRYGANGVLPYPPGYYGGYPGGPYCLDANRDGRCDQGRPGGKGPGDGKGDGDGANRRDSLFDRVDEEVRRREAQRSSFEKAGATAKPKRAPTTGSAAAGGNGGKGKSSSAAARTPRAPVETPRPARGNDEAPGAVPN